MTKFALSGMLGYRELVPGSELQIMVGRIGAELWLKAVVNGEVVIRHYDYGDLNIEVKVDADSEARP